MIQERGKLVKVIFEYEENTQTIHGEKAQEWIDAVNVCISISRIHGLPMKLVTWETNWKTKYSE